MLASGRSEVMKTRKPYQPKRPRPIFNSRPFAMYYIGDNRKVSWPTITINMVELLRRKK